MHVEDDGTRTYSHTSLSLWRLCKRRWFNRYVLHKKEVSGVAAAYSVEMVHKPIELDICDDAEWQIRFQAFRELLGDPDFEDRLHTVGTGKRILAAIREQGPQLEHIVSEREATIKVSGASRYNSRPDQVGTREGRRFTVDYKYTEKAWRGKDPWPVRPLLPYDDQLLGQAIATEADGFMRGTISLNPKTGEISGPVWQERLVDGQLRKEWLEHTAQDIQEIEHWITVGEWIDPNRPWPKNEDACFAFGRECPHLASCKAGWSGYPEDKRAEVRNAFERRMYDMYQRPREGVAGTQAK